MEAGGRKTSDIEKKGRKGRTEDESISRLLWSVTERPTGRWMPVGVPSEQRSTFYCIHLNTSWAHAVLPQPQNMVEMHSGPRRVQSPNTTDLSSTSIQIKKGQQTIQLHSMYIVNVCRTVINLKQGPGDETWWRRRCWAWRSLRGANADAEGDKLGRKLIVGERCLKAVSQYPSPWH